MTNVGKKINEIAECPICFQTFTEPRILPCVHSFCLKCLEQYRDKHGQEIPGKKLPCPLCRSEFIIPDEGMIGLKKNFLIDHFIEIKKLASEGTSISIVSCDICRDHAEVEEGESSEATMRCLDCEENMCDACSKGHRFQKLTRSHQVVRIGSNKEDCLRKTPRVIFCQTHTQKRLEYYCPLCKKIVCVSCLLENHSDHGCKAVTTVDADFRSKIEIEIAKVENDSSELLSKRNTLEQKKTEFLKTLSEEQNVILETSQRLKDMVDCHTNSLLENLSSVKAKHLKQMETDIEEVDEMRAMQQNFLAYSKELKSKGSAVVVCDCFDDVISRANKMEERNKGLVGRPYQVVKVSFKPNDFGQYVDSSKSEWLGQIEVLDLSESSYVSAVVLGISGGTNIRSNAWKINLQRPSENQRIQCIPSATNVETAAAVYDNTFYVAGVGSGRNGNAISKQSYGKEYSLMANRMMSLNVPCKDAKEALEEKEAKHQMLTRAPVPRKPKLVHHAAGPTTSMEKASEDRWTTAVGSSSKNRIDPSKMMKTAKSMKDEVQLFAPSWQESSACGMRSRGSSQGAKKPLAPSNRYQALEQIGSSSASEFADKNRSHFSPYGRNANQWPSLTESLAAGKRLSPSSLGQSSNVSHKRCQERDSQRTTTTHSSSGSPPVLPLSTGNTPKDQPLEPRTELSRLEIELKATNILDEYFNIQDLKETFTCVKELKSPKSLYMFVAFALNYVLEKKEVAMSLMGSLFHELLTKGVLSCAQFEMGLKEVLQEAESIAVDIPKVWEHLGVILASTIQNSHELWDLLKSACKLVPSGKDELLFRKTLEALSQTSGMENTSVGLRRSGMRWSDFVHTPLFSYCKQHNLEALDPVREELIALLTQHTDNQPIFDWIHQNVSEAEVESREFVRALVAAVCTCALSVSEKTNVQSVSYTVDEDQMILRETLLKKYLDHKSDRELQALYGLQALLHSLEHPPNILNQFFDIFYDREIISEEAFVEWENSKDPAEQTGKSVAYQSVRAFFEWLKEGTEETMW